MRVVQSFDFFKLIMSNFRIDACEVCKSFEKPLPSAMLISPL